MELKELKCKNCGANLEVEANAREVTCKFCHTKFAVESAENVGYEFEKGRMKARREELNNNLKEAQERIKANGAELGKAAQNMFDGIDGNEIEKTAKIVGKVFIVIFAVIFIFVGVCIFLIAMNIRKASSGVGVGFDKFEAEHTTNVLEMYSGTENVFSVKTALDEIVTNNKKNDHKITVVYNGTKTVNPDSIVKIKQSLDKDKYEISYDYNKDKLINKMTIKDIE